MRIYQKQKFYKEIGMTKQQFIQEKQKHMARLVVGTALAVHKKAIVAFPPKRIFRPKDRRPLVRIRKQEAQAAIPMLVYGNSIQMMMVAAEPMPMYPLGSKPGPVVVQQTGKPEVIVRPGEIYEICPTRKEP